MRRRIEATEGAARHWAAWLRVLAVSAVALLAPAAWADGIDETYRKPAGSPSWGSIFASFYDEGRFDRSYALVVGIGDYDDWPHLEAPPRDAKRVRDFLIDEAGFDHVTTLTEDKATLSRIRSLMVDTFPKLVGEDDRFLFYFSGHGTQREIAGRTIGYLPLKGSGRQSYSTMIDMDEVSSWASLLAHARQTLFVIDSCFSGLAGVQTKSDRLRDKKLDRLAQYGHHLITAGTADEQSVASLSRWGGSLFTDAFLKGVSGRADSETADFERDGIVSLKELMKYIEDRIDAESQKLKNQSPFNAPIKMSPQIANLQANVGEFFFVSEERKARLARRPDTPGSPGEAPEVKGSGGPAPSAGGGLPRDVLVFEQIKESDRPDDFELFLEQFPDSMFAPYARARMRSLEERDGLERSASLGEPARGGQPDPARGGEVASPPRLELDAAQRRDVQAALDVLGHDPGSLDGILGPNSRRAIRSWQEDAGLDPTGYLTEETLSRLLDEAAEARSVASARVEIPAAVPGTKVRLNDRPMGTAPLSLSLTPGTHTIRLTAEGYRSRDYRIRLSRGESRVLDYELARVTAVPAQEKAPEEADETQEADTTGPATEKERTVQSGASAGSGGSDRDAEDAECKPVAFLKTGGRLFKCRRPDGTSFYKR